MPNPTTDLSAFVHAGKIYTLGGYDASWKALNVTQVFDPTANGINLSWQVGPTLLRGRGDAFAAIVDNKAFVVGGFHDENDFKSPIAHLEMLDVARGASWVSRKAMNVSRGDKAVAALNNVLHVVGGETKNSQGHSVPLRDVEVYDPIGNVWYFGGDIPSDRFRFVAAAHGSSIFIFGGQGYLTGGAHGADGSKYPLMDTVEEYSERVSPAQVSRTATLLSPSFCVLFAVFIPAKLATLLLQDQR
jgi:N-acetylneuraminic acid mutarotase